jgi:hypothetical protein
VPLEIHCVRPRGDPGEEDPPLRENPTRVVRMDWKDSSKWGVVLNSDGMSFAGRSAERGGYDVRDAASSCGGATLWVKLCEILLVWVWLRYVRLS